ncbi:hypothetical protein ACFPMF_18135 [Larkinella bovis]|uniref:DUF3575 domain-containing protein n=1 Tax=Larkinella bovis TaxID=683041 RepID=A0ABW0IDD3_9BACT
MYAKTLLINGLISLNTVQKLMKTPFTLTVTGLLAAGFLHAQPSDPKVAAAPRPKPKMAVSLQVGVPVISPSTALKKTMNDNNLGGSTASWLGFTADYPVVKGLLAAELHVERFMDRWALAITTGIAKGSIHGKNFTKVDWRSFSLSPQCRFYSRQHITRFSVGPTVQWQQTASAEGVSGRYHTRKTVGLGATAEGAVRFPARSRLYLELGIAGQMIVNQHKNEIINWENGYRTAIPFTIPFSQVRTSFGLGVRL